MIFLSVSASALGSQIIPSITNVSDFGDYPDSFVANDYGGRRQSSRLISSDQYDFHSCLANVFSLYI